MTDMDTIQTIGRIGLSRIAFYTDMSNQHRRVIPLGVIAEIYLDNVHGLGLIARTTLTDEEKSLVGPMLRDKLKSPFELLNADFEWAWDNAQPGSCLIDLAARHRGSLRFETPAIRRTVWKCSTEDGAAMEPARKRLLDLRDKDFWVFLREHEDKERHPPNKGLDDFQYAQVA